MRQIIFGICFLVIFLGAMAPANAKKDDPGPPAIVSSPADMEVEVEAKVDLEVTVTGASPFSYQWYLDGAKITGATDETLKIHRAVSSDAGVYTVLVTNSLGSVWSRAARLTVHEPVAPVIVTQPSDSQATVGSNATFAVQATGVPAPTYQWRLNGVNIAQATNASLFITNARPSHAGRYSVAVANSVATVVSRLAELNVDLPMLPFADNFAGPGYVFSQRGAGKSSNTNATREPNEPDHGKKKGMRTSMWLRWWAPANGIATFTTAGSDFDTVLAIYTGDTLNKDAEVASDDDSGGFHSSKVSFNARAGVVYHIVVDGLNGASGKIVLGWEMSVTSEKLPEIVTEPGDNTGNTNDTITLQVAFEAFESTQVQWFFHGIAIPGAVQNTFRLTSLQPDHVGSYHVRLTAASGRTVVSRAADVQINGNGYTTVASRNKLAEAGDFAMLEGLGLAPVIGLAAGSGGGGGLARGYSGTQIFSTIGADKDLDEPNHCGLGGGASSWFVYQPAANGILAIDTDASGFDTILAVYVGGDGSFASLQSVACDNNSGADGIDSKVVFAVSANTRYYIAVDGVGGAQGKVVLNYLLGESPTITRHPASQSAPAGASVELSVKADGNPLPGYQWSYNGVVIAGATNSTFTVSGFNATAEGNYEVAVQNSLGLTRSSAATLFLNAPVRVFNRTVATNGCFKLRIVGPAGGTFHIDRSVDLQVWVPIATNASPTGVWEFLDSSSPNVPLRYYRVGQ